MSFGTLIHLALGDSQSLVVGNQSSSSATKGKSSTVNQDESPPVKKQKLQEEKKRNKFIEENLIKVIEDSSVPGGNTYQCSKCKKVIKTGKMRAVAHAGKCGKGKACKKRGKSQRKFPCNQCGHKETTKKAMISHRQSAHQVTKRRSQCSATLCMRYFSSVKSLRYCFMINCYLFNPMKSNVRVICRRHARQHVSRPKFPCSVCNKEFSRLEHMRRHKREAHLRPQGEVDQELGLIGRKVLEQRADSIKDLTKNLVDHLRASGETEARILQVQQIMDSRLYQPTSTRSVAASPPNLPGSSSSANLTGSSAASLPGPSSSSLPGSSSASRPDSSNYSQAGRKRACPPPPTPPSSFRSPKASLCVQNL